jgi:hypothetical protein
LFGQLEQGGHVQVSVAADGESLSLQVHAAEKPALTVG